MGQSFSTHDCVNRMIRLLSQNSRIILSLTLLATNCDFALLVLRPRTCSSIGKVVRLLAHRLRVGVPIRSCLCNKMTFTQDWLHDLRFHVHEYKTADHKWMAGSSGDGGRTPRSPPVHLWHSQEPPSQIRWSIRTQQPPGRARAPSPPRLHRTCAKRVASLHYSTLVAQSQFMPLDHTRALIRTDVQSTVFVSALYVAIQLQLNQRGR